MITDWATAEAGRPKYGRELQMTTPESRKAEALVLAEQLLGEVELSAIRPTDIARKASRLARLIDDTSATKWLYFELARYPDPLEGDARFAADRSNRRAQAREIPEGKDGPQYWVGSLSELVAGVEAAKARLPGCANPAERNSVVNAIRTQQGTVDAIVGAIYAYVAERYQELRFGAAVETAFEVVRREVDSSIGELVPDALPMLSAAFENAASSNPEHWASAAGTCRRLLKVVADGLRPAGEDIDGRKMGDPHYINRLIDWITQNSESATAAKIMTSDLSYLGDRLDAADSAGQKGAHDQVDRYEASRFITGTYLVLGDILRLADLKPEAEPIDTESASTPDGSLRREGHSGV